MKVDILRLSHNVRKNMKKEEDDENQYTTQSEQLGAGAKENSKQEEDDVKLKHRNLVLNFGDKGDDEEDAQATPITKW